MAEELEVTHRTVLRDINALTEAGLPIIAFQGNQGGFELGFDYRTRLTGLDADEAEALAVMLDSIPSWLDDLGMGGAARRAASKVRESLPDSVRQRLTLASRQFSVSVGQPERERDPRIEALGNAVRRRLKVRLNARSSRASQVHPVALIQIDGIWSVIDELTGAQIPLAEWGAINVSGLSY